MANDLTNYAESAVITWAFRPGQAAPTRPTSIKLCLLTAITTAETGAVTEASYTGYAAQDAGFGADADNAGTEQSNNTAKLTYPAVDATVTVVGLALKDHLGNYWAVKAITPVTYNAGDVPVVNAGTLTIDIG
jgi:hypothetical protein